MKSGIVALVGLLLGCGTSDSGSPPPGGDAGGSDTANVSDASGGPDSPVGGHAIKTVFLILMENHNWSDIKGSSSAPYINNMLLPAAAHAEAFYDNPAKAHPSEPNYLWLEAGDNLGITDDNPPSSNHQATQNHLVTLLKSAGITWRSYQEDITAGTCPISSVGKYAPKHNPMVFFDDVVGNPPSATAPECIAHMAPYATFAADLTSGSVAQYNFITPNLCNDMHDSCAPTNDQVKQGDTWLSTEVPRIQASPAYKNGGVIFVTWDESELGESPIGMIVVSPLAKPGGYSNTIKYYHSSTLRTVQEVFGVTPLIRDAANQPSLSDLFTSYP
jgi:phosphatidylinositol-3-phosphatase